MLDPNTIDFKKIGFKAGIEVHHQIDTKRKLFCNCKPVYSYGQPDYRFERYFRPVLGEMGDFDEGMLIEYEKGYRVIYHAFEETVCCYEQDEQPPFWPDKEAIYLGYELAYWLNCSAPVDEVVVSRKQYLDGSITTGFQRTMIVARDGWVPVGNKKIKITNLTVEEDAARKIKDENFGRTVYYNLDRLGIPLVEVITDHNDVDTPQELQKTAELIGLTLRLSGIGKRGIGSVRQDVNISITGGDRVEIKGVQDLDSFIDLATREVQRQDMLIKIASILKERKLKKEELEHTYFDLTEFFDRKQIPSNYIVMGIRLVKFNSLLGLEIQPGKDFGQDIIEKAELITGIPRINIYHSDELPEQALRKRQENNSKTKDNQLPKNFFFPLVNKTIDEKIRKNLQLAKDDAYFLAIGPQKWVIHAMKKIIERAKMALDGVPQETRRFLPDNNTEFLRVIHGKDRLYPDTDTPPVSIDANIIQDLKQKVKQRPWEIEKEFKEKYNLSSAQSKQLIRHDRIEIVKTLIEKYKITPKRVYRFFEETLLSISREGINIEDITDEQIIEILQPMQKGEYDYNRIPILIKTLISNPDKNLKQILADLKIKKTSEKELEKLFTDGFNTVKSETNFDKFTNNQIQNKITGFIMRKIMGSLSGKEVSDFVVKKLQENASKN